MLVTLLLAAISFHSPVHYDISLAGNFAEPRPNHFHGGTDVKTGQIEGKAIFSIGDGYVSEVSIGVGGYGNVVYVHHPEGYTSMYCHLKAFAPNILAAARAWQYKHKQNGGVIMFNPTDLPVAQGQLIAISGNTGASQAPHLHMELHETRTWDMMDPLDFIGAYVKDDLSPMAHGFMAYPQEGEGSFCGGYEKQSFKFSSHNLTKIFSAWGKVGFGLWANDYSEITYNLLGVRRVELYMNGKLQFRSDTHRIPSDENLQVNSWGDYEHYMHYGVWYMRSFIPHGVSLPIFNTNKDRGIINFNKECDYHMKYILYDFKGNKAEYTFTVHGHKTTFRKKTGSHPGRTLYWNRPNTYQLPGMSLTVGTDFLPENVILQPVIERVPNGLSNEYRLMPISTTMFHYGQLAIRLNKKVENTHQLYIDGNNGKDHYCGGRYENGYVIGKSRDLGATYKIKIDAEAPRLNPVNQGAWSSRKEIKMGIVDNESGIKSLSGYIDDRFVVFDEVPKSPWYKCDLMSTGVKRNGKMHTFKFMAEDNCGNKRVYTTQIKY